MAAPRTAFCPGTRPAGRIFVAEKKQEREVIKFSTSKDCRLQHPVQNPISDNTNVFNVVLRPLCG